MKFQIKPVLVEVCPPMVPVPLPFCSLKHSVFFPNHPKAQMVRSPTKKRHEVYQKVPCLLYHLLSPLSLGSIFFYRFFVSFRCTVLTVPLEIRGWFPSSSSVSLGIHWLMKSLLRYCPATMSSFRYEGPVFFFFARLPRTRMGPDFDLPSVTLLSRFLTICHWLGPRPRFGPQPLDFLSPMFHRAL